jgi:hypothetical protein
MQQPQGESIWGTINTCIEIALNIYYITAEFGAGIMIPKDKADTAISKKAAAMGQEDGDYLCYGKDDNMDVPMYEVLQKRAATCERLKASAIQQMKEIEMDGHLRLTDYFGECAPPDKPPESAAQQLDKVRNGIYFVQTGAEPLFAVHEAVADNFLSPLGYEFGRRSGEYLYYDLATCAVPINELKEVFSEVEDRIVSKDSLNATLCARFPAYVISYNDLVAVNARIPRADAPQELFLQQQLDCAVQDNSHEDEAQPERTVPEHSSGEETDYGFEP